MTDFTEYKTTDGNSFENRTAAARHEFEYLYLTIFNAKVKPNTVCTITAETDSDIKSMHIKNWMKLYEFIGQPVDYEALSNLPLRFTLKIGNIITIDDSIYMPIVKMEFESTIRNIHQEVKFKAFDGEMFTDSITCKSYEFHQLFMQTFGERFDISKSYRKIIRSFNDIEESVFKNWLSYFSDRSWFKHEDWFIGDKINTKKFPCTLVIKASAESFNSSTVQFDDMRLYPGVRVELQDKIRDFFSMK